MDEIIERYKDMVYRIAFSYCKNRSDADDIFQEVFLRYFRKAPQFENDDHEKAWLIRVTVNCSKSVLMSPWRKHEIKLDDNIHYEDQYESDLFRAVMQLPAKYRIVIELYYYEGYKLREIAHILKKKEVTVRQQLVRAREQLKKALTEES
ncbi:sigma-70 family RNA polymerase sigma factor [Eubacterium sp. MSJ-13]|uniref:RNA polymerase sigma factor n=1 Tax=Eubacterium sp. MSJ-13 TaxID=2841513 RepID=UPI001C1137E1|nr:sigma-70 family RNA polymerase sigma factor [Eubacterium sp. MSJ-13]MBU5478490.1 sigma-70 family RNA polymerase sigma factor [Eubacterium sp. MSJ-13]